MRGLPPADRAQALDTACAGDSSLRTEVESLLDFDREGEILAPRDVPRADAITRPGVGLVAAPLAEAAARTDAALAEEAHPGGKDPLGLVGETLDGRYRVDSLVSEGGFSYVYRAEQIRWNRPAAIKVFKLERSDAAIMEAFVKEGALHRDLSRHTTAIVQSHDVGSWTDRQGRPRIFTVLEWLDGETLAALVARERRGGKAEWSLERVLHVLGPVAEALGVAHRHGIAHRDIKPANIFIVDEDDGRETTKLLDFGVAKVAAEYESGFQSTGGKIAAFTVGYAAPEQLSKRHGTTGPWTDVYSLALVCVELLAGRRAAKRDQLDGHRFAGTGPRPTPASFGVTVAPAVEEVFARAFEPDADQRFPDATSFWSALVEAARPVVVPSPPAAPSSIPADEPRVPHRWRTIALTAAVAITAALALWFAR